MELGITPDGQAALRNPQAQNSYGYAGNNPITYSDPTGRAWYNDLYNYAKDKVSVASQATFNAFANSRPEYTAQQMQSMNPDNVALYYRQAGDPAGSVRLNEQKMQEYARTALAGALLVVEGAAVSSEATIARGGTYRLVDDNTGQVMRTGRTSDLSRRQAEHANNPSTNGYKFDIVPRTDDYATQRGLEQRIYEQYRAPLDKISPISAQNPNLNKYLDAARRYLNQ